MNETEMALPKEHLMGQLHIAYVTAVTARAGATYNSIKQDYGVDGRISEIVRLPNGKFTESNWLFNCQLKATTRFGIKNEQVSYEMDVDAYNRLVLFSIIIYT